MEGHLTPSAHKILSRFDWNKKEAVAYCLRLSREYPRLKEEYREYAKEIAGK